MGFKRGGVIIFTEGLAVPLAATFFGSKFYLRQPIAVHT
jgi:hypothetical protein